LRSTVPDTIVCAKARTFAHCAHFRAHRKCNGGNVLTSIFALGRVFALRARMKTRGLKRGSLMFVTYGQRALGLARGKRLTAKGLPRGREATPAT